MTKKSSAACTERACIWRSLSCVYVNTETDFYYFARVWDKQLLCVSGTSDLCVIYVIMFCTAGLLDNFLSLPYF